jgi:hypothetical protein
MAVFLSAVPIGPDRASFSYLLPCVSVTTFLVTRSRCQLSLLSRDQAPAPITPLPWPFGPISIYSYTWTLTPPHFYVEGGDSMCLQHASNSAHIHTVRRPKRRININFLVCLAHSCYKVYVIVSIILIFYKFQLMHPVVFLYLFIKFINNTT